MIYSSLSQFLLAFAVVPGWLTLLALLHVSLFGLLVGWTLLTGPPRRPLVLSRMGMLLPLGLLLTTFGPFGVGVLNWVYIGLIPKLVFPLKLAALPFLVEVCYGFVAGVSEAELRVSHGEHVDVHCAQYFVNSSLAPVLLFRRHLESVAECTQRY